MKKYMVLKGVPGALVADPASADPTRYVAQRRKPFLDGKVPQRPGDRYEPVVQAHAYSPDLVKQVRTGMLEQIGPIVVAETAEEAMAMVQKLAAQKPKKESN